MLSGVSKETPIFVLINIWCIIFIYMENKKKEVVYAFIDSQNLNLGVRNDIRTKDGKHFRYKGWNLDFAKFYAYLRDEMHVEKSFIFIGFMADNQELYDSLTKIGYVMVYKPLLEVTGEASEVKIKGNIDAELVMHTMINFPKYDKAIIVSGDGDFQCLVEYLEQQKKLAKIIIPNTWTYSSLLEPYKAFFLNINDLKKKLSYTHKKKAAEEPKVKEDHAKTSTGRMSPFGFAHGRQIRNDGNRGKNEVKKGENIPVRVEKKVEVFPGKKNEEKKPEERHVRFH